MKRVYGLVLMCLVAGFCVGCDSAGEDEVSPAAELPKDQQQQMDAYSQAAQKQTPNAAK